MKIHDGLGLTTQIELDQLDQHLGHLGHLGHITVILGMYT